MRVQRRRGCRGCSGAGPEACRRGGSKVQRCRGAGAERRAERIGGAEAAQRRRRGGAERAQRRRKEGAEAAQRGRREGAEAAQRGRRGGAERAQRRRREGAEAAQRGRRGGAERAQRWRRGADLPALCGGQLAAVEGRGDGLDGAVLLEELEGGHRAHAADGARVVTAAKDAKVDEGLPAHLYRGGLGLG